MMQMPFVILDTDPVVATDLCPRYQLLFHVFFSYRMLRELELSRYDRTLDDVRDAMLQTEYSDLLSASQRSAAAYVWWRSYLIALLDRIGQVLDSKRLSVSPLDVKLNFAVVPRYIRDVTSDKTDAEFMDYIRDQIPRPQPE